MSVPVITAYFGEWEEGTHFSFCCPYGQVRNACGILAAKKSGLKKFRK